MRKFLGFLFCFIFFNCKGQNLLQNGSFENYTTCPSILGQLNYASPWYNPTTNTPDFFNECSTGNWVDVSQNFLGNQAARSGSGYAGVGAYDFSANGREYISQQLSSPLVLGVNYYLEFYVSLSDTSSHATDGLGAYLSLGAVDKPDGFNLPYTPQVRQPDGIAIIDKIGWTRISGFYTATGGESYVTIGNFYPDSTTTIDTVSSTGNFWIAYYYIDDVLLIPDSLVNVKAIDPVSGAKFSVYPNPSSGLFQISSTEEFIGVMMIYDLKGQLMMEKVVNEKASLDLGHYDSGVYFYQINDGSSSQYGKLIISK